MAKSVSESMENKVKGEERPVIYPVPNSAKVVEATNNSVRNSVWIGESTKKKEGTVEGPIKEAEDQVNEWNDDGSEKHSGFIGRPGVRPDVWRQLGHSECGGTEGVHRLASPQSLAIFRRTAR